MKSGAVRAESLFILAPTLSVTSTTGFQSQLFRLIVFRCEAPGVGGPPGVWPLLSQGGPLWVGMPPVMRLCAGVCV